MTTTENVTCACGHARSTHTHYRPGNDCGVVNCGCRSFKRLRWYHRFMPATFKR